MKSWFAVLIGIVALVPRVYADCSVQGVTVTGTLGPKVGIYDEGGKFIEEIASEQLAIGRELLGCNESLGLVKVSLVSGGERWIDRADLKVGLPGGRQPARICVKAPSSRAADHTEAAVAGIDPAAAKDCAAPSPSKP